MKALLDEIRSSSYGVLTFVRSVLHWRPAKQPKRAFADSIARVTFPK